MLRRWAAVGLLSMASLLFALRFAPPGPVGEDLDAVLAQIEVRETTTTTAPRYSTLPTVSTSTTTLPFGVSEFESDYVVFHRGVLQLRARVDSGVLIEVEMIRVPARSQRARQISTEAEPFLRAAALEAQHYRLHIISGATETSLMYMRALRDVLTQAEFCLDPKCESLIG